jgi:hypothetical protein
VHLQRNQLGASWGHIRTDGKDGKYNDGMNKTGAPHNNGVAGNKAAWYDSSPEDDNPVVWAGAEPADVAVVLVDVEVVAVVLEVADVVVALPDVAVVAVVFVVVAAVDLVEVWFGPKQTNRGST